MCVRLISLVGNQSHRVALKTYQAISWPRHHLIPFPRLSILLWHELHFPFDVSFIEKVSILQHRRMWKFHKSLSSQCLSFPSVNALYCPAVMILERSLTTLLSFGCPFMTTSPGEALLSDTENRVTQWKFVEQGGQFGKEVKTITKPLAFLKVLMINWKRSNTVSASAARTANVRPDRMETSISQGKLSFPELFNFEVLNSQVETTQIPALFGHAVGFKQFLDACHISSRGQTRWPFLSATRTPFSQLVVTLRLIYHLGLFLRFQQTHRDLNILGGHRMSFLSSCLMQCLGLKRPKTLGGFILTHVMMFFCTVRWGSPASWDEGAHGTPTTTIFFSKGKKRSKMKMKMLDCAFFFAEW